MLDIVEHPEAGYAARTRHNALAADLTAAFAVDFRTAGERLTRRAAGERYIALPIAELAPIEAARRLFRAMRDREARTLNVAGNGIQTLAGHGWTQESACVFVAITLFYVHQHRYLSRVLSGGQTGIDTAGLAAAQVLGIDAVATLPRGLLQRDARGRDSRRSPESLRAELHAWSAQLAPLLAALKPGDPVRRVHCSAASGAQAIQIASRQTETWRPA